MRWPGAISRSAASFPRSAQGEAAARREAAAGAGLIRIGTEPPIASSRVLCALSRSMRGIERIRPCV